MYASSEVHNVVIRAAAVLGLGRRTVAPISVDAKQRIDLDYLREALTVDRSKDILPIAIVANAGTVNTGAMDPIEQMAGIASTYDNGIEQTGRSWRVLHRGPKVFENSLACCSSRAVMPREILFLAP